MGKPVKILSAIFCVLVLISAVFSEKDDLPEMFKHVGIAVLALNACNRDSHKYFEQCSNIYCVRNLQFVDVCDRWVYDVSFWTEK